MDKAWLLVYLLWSSALCAKPTTAEPDDVRLVGGASRCAGRLEVKPQTEWRAGCGWYGDWNLKAASVVCRQMTCGSALHTYFSDGSTRQRPVWEIRSSCVGSESSLRECVTMRSDTNSYSLKVICSGSVRLVNGGGVCSGRVEVKADQSWVSVCEGDFDQQEAEVVCRQRGCGPPSVLQGALYGEGKAPMWTKEFQCEGSESDLLDCRTSASTGNTCSPDKTVGLTCSEPDDVRLVGGASRCAGRLEVKRQTEWRAGYGWYGDWNLKEASLVCRQLTCGSALHTYRSDGSTDQRLVWYIRSSCVGSESSLRECVTMMSYSSSSSLQVICSGKPILSVSCPIKGVSEGQQQGLWVMEGFNFSMDCSIQLQYPGGSFQLTFTGANTTRTYTQTAVNHSAHFPFPAADHADQGNYRCVYRATVFSRNFTSESDFLSLTVKERPMLFKPILSVSCPIKGVSEGQQQGLWVMEGFNFSMDCSIQPQYPGGSLQLTFTGANTTRTYTQTAVNHSAHFLFPAADHDHQGNYRCVYRATVFSHDFTSESDFLFLTVKASHLKAFLIRATMAIILWVQPIFQYFFWKWMATRRQRAAVENIEMTYVNVPASSADARPSEDEDGYEEPDEHLDDLTSLGGYEEPDELLE